MPYSVLLHTKYIITLEAITGNFTCTKKFQFVVVGVWYFGNINEMIFVSLCTLFRLKMGWAGQLPIENTLSLLVVPRVTNIHLSPAALMNEVTRHNKGFLWVLSSLIPFFVWTDIDKMIKWHTLLVAIVLHTALRASLKKGGWELTKPVIANRCINVLCKQLCS